jgi:hypothetical protein
MRCVGWRGILGHAIPSCSARRRSAALGFPAEPRDGTRRKLTLEMRAGQPPPRPDGNQPFQAAATRVRGLRYATPEHPTLRGCLAPLPTTQIQFFARFQICLIAETLNPKSSAICCSDSPLLIRSMILWCAAWRVAFNELRTAMVSLWKPINASSLLLWRWQLVSILAKKSFRCSQIDLRFRTGAPKRDSATGIACCQLLPRDWRNTDTTSCFDPDRSCLENMECPVGGTCFLPLLVAANQVPKLWSDSVKHGLV